MNRKEALMLNNQPFIENRDAGVFTQAMVDTVQEPLLVPDKDLRVLAASRSLYLTFRVDPTDIQRRLLYALGDGQCSPSAWTYNEVTTTFSG